MISRSRLWSNFLHWRTNQLLSFHKFPQKNNCFSLLPFIPSRLADSYSFAIRYIRLHSKSSNTECVQTQYISDLLLRKDDPDPPSIWWVSSAALRFQGVVHLGVQVLRTSTVRVVLQVMTSLLWLLARIGMSQPTMSSTVASKAQTQLLL